ncbi:MAG: dTMP kinase [Candidatus Bathyarchaeia archaeon]
MAKKGAFIVIEGLDGSGKTTQARILAQRLRRSHGAVYTQEPSSGRIGLFIRNRILYGERRPPTTVEALLFAADRIDHVQNEVQPALDEGRLVVSDRYVYSSLAYQGSAGLSLEWIEAINQHALKPDLALFIDVDPEAVLARLKRRKSVMENLETQRKVRAVYLKFVEKGELVRVDGGKPKRAVAEDVLAVVTKFLKARG